MAELEDSATTRQPGRYGAFLQNGQHVRFGADVFKAGDHVTRSVSDFAVDSLSGVHEVSWTGVEFPTPTDAGLQALDVGIESEHGPIPAWVIGEASTATWAVHVHGLGSTRAGTLRGVQVASELGLTSLVTTYRNSAEGPAVGSRRSTLGIDESLDVERALEYASENGAERIVLFGWSMGANIALRLAHQPRWRQRIIAIVAESPVLDWRRAIAANLKALGVPGQCARLSYPWLSRTAPSRFVGLDRPIDLDALDWSPAGRVRTPTLILQGTEDRSTPWQAASRVASRSTRVDIELFEADHTTSWNSDPQRWRNAVSTWTSDQLGLGSDIAG